MTGRAFAIAASLPPHMIESWPFSAPACPPETGASTLSARAAASRRAISAETVVWSMNTASARIAAKAPSGPSVTCSRSPSLPTHVATASAPAAAAAGVSATSSPVASAFARVRL